MHHSMLHGTALDRIPGLGLGLGGCFMLSQDVWWTRSPWKSLAGNFDSLSVHNNVLPRGSSQVCHRFHASCVGLSASCLPPASTHMSLLGCAFRLHRNRRLALSPSSSPFPESLFLDSLLLLFPSSIINHIHQHTSSNRYLFCSRQPLIYFIPSFVQYESNFSTTIQHVSLTTTEGVASRHIHVHHRLSRQR